LTATGAIPAEVRLIIDTLDDGRAKDITLLDLHGVSETLDYFIIATGESGLQLRALQEAVREAVKAAGQLPRAVEGPSDRWTLIDYGSVILHIMSREARAFYDLEGLWADAVRLDALPGSDTPPLG
jgi:ribosome-associated protein